MQQNQVSASVSGQLHMEITALEQLAEVTALLESELQQWQVHEDKQMDLKLCVMEAVQNALIHGGTAQEAPIVQIDWQCKINEFCFTVTDNGLGVPEEIRTGEYQETLKESGRGLLLMRVILDEVQFNETGNAVTGILRW